MPATRTHRSFGIGGDQAGADAALQNGQAALGSADNLRAIGQGIQAVIPNGTVQVAFGESLSVANILEGALDAGISSGINAAYYGTDFGSGFANSLVGTVVALGLAETQTFIGNQNLGEGTVPHALLHGLAGCAAAELQGGSCGAGAAGGIAQSIYSGILERSDLQLTQQQERNQAELLGATIGYIFSEGDDQNVSIAAAVALSGLANNRQLHDYERERLGELQEGKSEEEKQRLRAAACFLVKCADGVSPGHPGYDERRALQDAGASYQTEQNLLRGQVLMVTRFDPQNGPTQEERALFTYTGPDAAFDYLSSTSIMFSDARAQARFELEQERAGLDDTNDQKVEVCGRDGCRFETRRSEIDGKLALLSIADYLLPSDLGEGAFEVAAMAVAGGASKLLRTGIKANTKTSRFFADDEVLGLSKNANNGPRFISDAAGNTLDTNATKNLTSLSPSDVNFLAGRGATTYDMTAAPNSYANLGNGHAVVYGADGRALYDVSASRIKVIEWHQNQVKGQWFPKTNSDLKVFEGNVPQSLLDD